MKDFLDKYTKIHEATGKKYINAVEALIELFARLKSATDEIRSLQTAIGDVCQWGDSIEKRLNIIEGKKTIEVVTPQQANIILKG